MKTKTTIKRYNLDPEINLTDPIKSETPTTIQEYNFYDYCIKWW